MAETSGGNQATKPSDNHKADGDEIQQIEQGEWISSRPRRFRRGPNGGDLDRSQAAARGEASNKQFGNFPKSGEVANPRAVRARPRLPQSTHVSNFTFNPSPRSWSSIVGASQRENDDVSLSFIPFSVDNGKEFVSIPDEEIKQNAENWANTIVAYVVGQRPHYNHLKAYIKMAWKTKEEVQILSRDNGFFIFKFVHEEDCQYVLNNGPWFFDQRLIIMRKWSENMGLEKDLLTHLPVWIKLPNLDLKYWSNKSISRIVSMIGKPLYMDGPTASASRLEFARVLVEISTHSDLKKKVAIRHEDGQIYEQDVVYEWTPPRCSRCKLFGHYLNVCPRPIESGWKAKEKVMETSVPSKGACSSSSYLDDVPENCIYSDGDDEIEGGMKMKTVVNTTQDDVITSPKEGLQEMVYSLKASSLKTPRVDHSSYVSAKTKSRKKRALEAVDISETSDRKKEPNESLVGLDIKVWWPEDAMFYEGVVESYDPDTMKHKVVYSDGDVEVLLLKDEKYELVKVDSEVVGSERKAKGSASQTVSESQQSEGMLDKESPGFFDDDASDNMGSEQNMDLDD